MFMKYFGIISIFLFLNGCLQHTALLGPAFTVASSGNIYQAGLSYGSNKAITKITGKTPLQNIQEALIPKKNDSKTISLVKNKIEKVRKDKLISNQ